NTSICPYCGGTYCSEHIHPLDHFCEGITNKRSARIRLASYGANNVIIIICTILFFISILNWRLMVDLFALHPSIAHIFKMPWQIFTSMFLHIEFWHFFVNMFVLLFFGSELERRLGSKRYVEIFIVSGLAGSLGYIIYANLLNSYVPALGASAAIFGVFGCLAIIAPEVRIMIFPIPIPIGIRTALFLFAAYDFWMMILSSAGVFITNVANVAHLAGLFVGLYYGRRYGRRKIRVY
ncbi:MAG: rhomboid family intramembrane serine protease, partial [Archaeoglobaceae archaeon]